MRYLLIAICAAASAAALFSQEKPPELRLPEKFKPRMVETFARGENPRWDATIINADKAWPYTKGKGVLGMVGDTGIDSDHPELKGTVVDAKDFTNSASGVRDVQGHGTHCAGIIAGHLQLDGIAPECQLLNAKVLGDNGSGEFGWMANAIEWGITKKARFMSFSLGSGPDRTPPEQSTPALLKAIRKAIDAGIIVIVAAGNDNGSGENGGFPARYGEVVPELIVVAACDQSKNIAKFSTRSKSVVVTAPGVDILSSLPNGKYAEWDGTSMACPKVAGVAALYIADCDNAGVKPSPAEFKKLIQATSSTQNPNPPTITSGWGLIQAQKFVGRKVVTPVPTPIPTPVGSVVIEFNDLSPTKRAELLLNGVDKFRLEIGHSGNTLPSRTIPASARDYPAAVKAVARGEQITLAIGVPAPTGAYYADRVESLTPGQFESPGVYDCKIENGQPIMRLRGAIQQLFAPAQQYAPASSCGPGGCPQPWTVPGFRSR